MPLLTLSEIGITCGEIRARRFLRAHRHGRDKSNYNEKNKFLHWILLLRNSGKLHLVTAGYDWRSKTLKRQATSFGDRADMSHYVAAGTLKKGVK